MPDSKAEGYSPAFSDGPPPGQSIDEGVVDDIVFRSDESGYTVAELAVSEDRMLVAVGIMPYLAAG
nr:hypothetical protein [Clostridia bacterium]